MEKTPLPPRLLITPSQLAKAINVSTGHVYRLVQQRRVPFVRVGGSVRFRPESINEWIRRQEVATVAQALRGERQ
jgi:excisionase family DNA binding protein